MKLLNNEKGGTIINIIIAIAVVSLLLLAHKNGFFTDEKKREKLMSDASSAINDVIDNVQDGGMKIVCIDGYKWVVDGERNYQLGTKGMFGYLKPIKCDQNPDPTH